MNVVVHFPESEDGKLELQERVAKVHTEAVVNCISRLTIPLEQKLSLIKSIQENVGGQQN